MTQNGPMKVTQTPLAPKASGSRLGCCVVCASERSQPIFAVKEAPIHPFCPPATLGLEPGFGVLDIVACTGCGHIYNAGFNPNRVDELYAANVLTNTPVSDTMLKGLESTADFILARAPAKPSVVDVGGGSGVLAILLARRAAEVHLVEPSRALVAEDFASRGVTLHSAMFPPPGFAGRQFDVLLSRQVIEHVPSPDGFLQSIRRHVRPNGMVYIELPSAEYIVTVRSVVDFHYPHVHYYRHREMEVLFARAGFAIEESIEIKNGHDVGFILRPVKPHATTPASGALEASAFAAALAERRTLGQQRLAALKGTIGLYGANAYSQALLGLYPDAAKFGIVFDDTPMYAGQRAYGPGLDIPIEAPRAERFPKLGAVVIAAYLHDLVIARKLRAFNFDRPIYTVRSDAQAGQGEVPPSLFT
jgi:2-polyprenyl-3-methyl-5-hydroxy-6-metoxy-1,4-benzoquinol methylase